MKKFDVEITENAPAHGFCRKPLHRKEAEKNRHENRGNNEDYVLDSADFVGVDFQKLWVSRNFLKSKKKWKVLSGSTRYVSAESHHRHGTERFSGCCRWHHCGKLPFR